MILQKQHLSVFFRKSIRWYFIVTHLLLMTSEIVIISQDRPPFCGHQIILSSLPSTIDVHIRPRYLTLTGFQVHENASRIMLILLPEHAKMLREFIDLLFPLFCTLPDKHSMVLRCNIPKSVRAQYQPYVGATKGFLPDSESWPCQLVRMVKVHNRQTIL